jgi:hypothetical protein
MKRFASGLLAIVALLGLAPSVRAQGIVGSWELSVETPQGANTSTLSLKQDADKLTGELSSQLGSVPVTGTSTGDDASVVANIDVQGISLQLTFTGKVAGDTFNGQVKLGDFGEFPFTGKRKAADAAPVASVAAPPGTDLSGTWNVVLMITGLGEFPVTAEIKQTGNAIGGTLKSVLGETPVAGTYTDNALKLEFSADTPQGKIAVTMTGEPTPTGLKGKATLAGMGEADWTATRAQ